MLRRAAAECDVIVTSGGVSVGEADFVKPAVEAEGELLMWKIAMKPGRPLAFVEWARRISSGCREIRFQVRDFPRIRPAVSAQDAGRRRRASARDSRARRFRLARARSRREFLRVKWNARGGLDLYPTQDSAVLMSTAWADGLVDNPASTLSARGHGELHAVFGAVSVKVKILYLASLREQLGKSGEDVEISPATSTVAGLRTLLMARGGAWQTVLAQGRACALPSIRKWPSRRRR